MSLYSHETEAAVIGALMNNPSTIAFVCKRIDHRAFHRPENGRLFMLLLKLHVQGRHIDLITVPEAILREPEPMAFGDMAEIIALQAQAAPPAALDSYCLTLSELQERRRIDAAARTILEQVQDRRRELSEIQAAVSAAATMAPTAAEHERPFTRTMEEIERRRVMYYHNQTQAISTGIQGLDDLLDGGLRPGELAILAARPSRGKSALGLQLALAPMLRKRSVLIISREMSHKAMASRMLANVTGIDSRDIKKGRLTDSKLADLYDAADRLDEARPYIYDDARTITEIGVRARILHKAVGISMVVVDYLQLVHPDSSARGRSREQEVASVSAGLKDLALELGIPVLCLSQLNRQGDADTQPSLEHLRESGAIEQDADIIWFIAYPNGYDLMDPLPRVALVQAKNREGQTGALELVFDKRMQRFYEPGDSRYGEDH